MATISLTETRMLLAERLHAQQARILRDNVLEQPATVTQATLPGDTRKLRGIPAIGRGVSGASPGTQPEQATLRREQ